jgi:hypothetical protein
MATPEQRSLAQKAKAPALSAGMAALAFAANAVRKQRARKKLLGIPMPRRIGKLLD